MMSTSQGGHLQERHRQHRRQISTPTALEAAKPPTLPAQALQRINAHRRGQSLDQRGFQMQQQQQQRPQSVQDGRLPVTNQSAVQQQPQSVLREVQQKRLGRQGQQAFHHHSSSMPFIPDCQTLSQDELQVLTNHISNDNHENMAYMNQNIGKVGNQNMGAQPMNVNFNLMQQQQQLLMRNQSLPTNDVWDMYQQENLGTFPPQANMIPADMRRPSVQSDVSTNAQRPQTPTHNSTRYFPITPATTPFKKSMGIPPHNREVQPSPTKEQSLSVSEAANASYMQRAKSLQGVPGTTSQQRFDLPSPPNTASFEVDGFDTFDYSQESRFAKSESQSSSHRHHVPSLSASSSFYSSPEMSAMPSPGASEKAHKVPIFPATPTHKRMSSTTSTASSTPAKPAKLSPRVASIDNLNLDDRVHASIKQTGVSIDEIASYIHGPEPEDGKWVCLHPGCERRFGRKENIKSHVQTHLGDRQYKCDHCEKCFVRGHDLKRHAKIHTGDKPYECLCGNVFARHDALTRHRQRGMCVGGYKGIVRKTTKRGRPKKHRPEMEERQDKASRTRQRVIENSSDSFCGSSDTYRSSPPSEIFENMSLRGSSPMDNGPMFNTPNYSSLPPDAFTFTPPASPGCSTGNKPSPHHNPRSLTPSTEDEMLPMSSPSKQPLDKIVEEFIAEPETYHTNSSNANLSSPHTAPTLAGSSHDSDLDIFINQDATTTGLGDDDFPALTEPSMATFPDYVNTAALDGGSMDFFPGKSFSAGPTMDDDFFSFQFQVDEQPSEFFLG